uniref:Uncharacterized protein n=1 Tax=Anopheles quadriannulatus TaxID=34691 RepID=A0A182XSW3_ANOQN
MVKIEPGDVQLRARRSMTCCACCGQPARWRCGSSCRAPGGAGRPGTTAGARLLARLASTYLPHGSRSRGRASGGRGGGQRVFFTLPCSSDGTVLCQTVLRRLPTVRLCPTVQQAYVGDRVRQGQVLLYPVSLQLDRVDRPDRWHRMRVTHPELVPTVIHSIASLR